MPDSQLLNCLKRKLREEKNQKRAIKITERELIKCDVSKEPKKTHVSLFTL